MFVEFRPLCSFDFPRLVHLLSRVALLAWEDNGEAEAERATLTTCARLAPIVLLLHSFLKKDLEKVRGMMSCP